MGHLVAMALGNAVGGGLSSMGKPGDVTAECWSFDLIPPARTDRPSESRQPYGVCGGERLWGFVAAKCLSLFPTRKQHERRCWFSHRRKLPSQRHARSARLCFTAPTARQHCLGLPYRLIRTRDDLRARRQAASVRQPRIGSRETRITAFPSPHGMCSCTPGGK